MGIINTIINQQILMDRINALDNITKRNEELLSDGKRYADFYNDFTRKILQKYRDDRKNENIILSPASILRILLIAAESTSGSTKNEIVKALSNTIDFKDICSLLRSMSYDFSNSAVCINSVMENMLLPEYKKNRQIEKFREALLVINNNDQKHFSWIKEHVNEISDDSVDFINVAVFREVWDIPFEEKDMRIECFDNIDLERVKTSMLHGKGNYYIENEYFTGFSKDFVVTTTFYPSPRLLLVELLPDTTEFAFMALLPKSNEKSSLYNALNQIDFSELFFKRLPAQVFIEMPKFISDFSEDISDFCKSVGIHTIFTNKADFSSMTTASVHAKSFFHHATFRINHFAEIKLKASNKFTLSDKIDLGDKELPEKEVILNRPFVYAVIHKKTGLPVFVGVLNRIE